MREINLKKTKDSVLNTIFLNLEYMSGDGDGDAYDNEEVALEKHITFSNYTEHLEEIENIIKKYELISKFTDCNNELYKGEYEDGFEYIKENYSEELAILFENVPTDTTYYLRKAHLNYISLCGYNDKGEYFTTCNLI